jgi:organic radical activating enzyme
MIDPVSNSFCAAKWLNATIWLGSGMTTSCHHPPAHRIDLEEIKKNPSAIHNSHHKKVMRAMMLLGERPSECDYCWKVEDIKRENVSDRVYKTVIYKDSDVERISKMRPEEDVDLRTLEIAFDRRCNFACTYCNSSFSTTWAKDIGQYGAYQNMVSDGAAAFQHDGKWAEPFGIHDHNPYIEAFWKWWPKLSESLQELRVTGGEPLLSKDVWKLFEFFKENGSGNMQFSLNTNLGADDDLIDKMIKYSHYVKDFSIYTSCEAIGEQAEYIRDGLNWEKFERNMVKIAEKANIRALNVMMTINSTCLYSITDFMDWMLSMKSRFTDEFVPVWSVNLLRFPSFMNPVALPDDLRMERKEHLESWLSTRKYHPFIHQMEIDGVQRLIDYLDVIKTPHRKTSSKMSRWRDFKTFHKQYDSRRGKNFEETFPEVLTKWYQGIPETDLGRYQELVNGDAQNQFEQFKEQDKHLIKKIEKLIKEEGWVLDPAHENPR